MRWGILWRPLSFSLKNNIQIIDACLRLHNFIVNYRESLGNVTVIESLEREIFTEENRRFMAINQICTTLVLTAVKMKHI